MNDDEYPRTPSCLTTPNGKSAAWGNKADSEARRPRGESQENVSLTVVLIYYSSPVLILERQDLRSSIIQPFA
jgi:hypothetical protein